MKYPGEQPYRGYFGNCGACGLLGQQGTEEEAIANWREERFQMGRLG